MNFSRNVGILSEETLSDKRLSNLLFRNSVKRNFKNVDNSENFLELSTRGRSMGDFEVHI